MDSQPETMLDPLRTAKLNFGGAILGFTRANLNLSGVVLTRISNWLLRSLK